MSDRTVRASSASFAFACGLLERYLEICPDTVWNEKSGGWPVWQQFYHAVSAFTFFVSPEGAPPAPLSFSPQVTQLLDVAEGPGMSKADAGELLASRKSAVKAYIDGLTDADLPEKHVGLSARMGNDTTHAQVLGLLAAHTLYHLGSCDAALRNHGLEGAF
jgi:hypothetical protein